MANKKKHFINFRTTTSIKTMLQSAVRYFKKKYPKKFISQSDLLNFILVKSLEDLKSSQYMNGDKYLREARCDLTTFKKDEDLTSGIKEIKKNYKYISPTEKVEKVMKNYKKNMVDKRELKNYLQKYPELSKILGNKYKFANLVPAKFNIITERVE